MKKVLLLGAALAIAGASTLALAADHPFKKEIDARQGLMQIASFHVGVLAAMAKGERPYDAKLAAAAANNINLAAMVDQMALWPEGSDLSNAALAGKTAAKPEGWLNMSDVTKKHDAWASAAAGLAKVAGNGLDALKPAVGEVGKACKACHDDYRQKL